MASGRLRLRHPGNGLYPRFGSHPGAYDTHESSERAALKELLSGLVLEGMGIQADELHELQSSALALVALQALLKSATPMASLTCGLPAMAARWKRKRARSCGRP